MAIQDLNPFAGRQKVKLVEFSGTTSVEFDASKDEDHTGENDVTDFPVEEGSDVTDNSRPKPRALQIHAFVTGTPVSFTNTVTPPSELASRGKDAWVQMDKWRRSGTRLTVITTLFRYGSMVITKLSVPRTPQNSDGIEFTVTLKQIVLAQSKTVPKPVRTIKQESNAVGSKPTTPATPAVQTQAQGFLQNGSDYVGKIADRFVH